MNGEIFKEAKFICNKMLKGGANRCSKRTDKPVGLKCL